MTNNYESLLDEPFQMLCQDLLVLEYPGVQCMPVGMPDGGRDAVIPGRPGQGAIVYQVKYARNSISVKDRAKWLIDALRPELPKIATLVKDHNVNRYVLMTNMQGTSHLKSGSIDLVQKFIDENLSIQSQCLWRDDLDRRLDPHIGLKLKFPGLISGEDALALLWHLAGTGEDRSRRENAFNAYMAYHYEQDQRVRFKEVGLSSNSLFDLYIDVPGSLRTDRTDRQVGQKHLNAYMEALTQAATLKIQHAEAAGGDKPDIKPPHGPEVSSPGEDYLFDQDESDFIASIGEDGEVHVRTQTGFHGTTIGTAELILSGSFMDQNPCLVLEGAPGQGKSTLSQYLMQVHRARLLAKADDLAKLSTHCASYPMMLPIKIELRDVAVWLSGVDPWGIKQDKAHGKPVTFEAAIAGHIERYSGGVRFEVSDLLETLGSMPALIVLDALDEVADLEDRRKVVEEVTAGIARLRQQNQEIRVLITSRPTSISKSPTFARDKFLYMTLMPISHQLAMDYATRWARARALDARDSNELTSVLRRRLDSPHIAELAKNTMQLTILLWLISLRGPSLPDKRTDLYDTYFTVFMDRESEKDSVVRDKRALILSLHMYIGFYLHAKAEARRTTGRISTQDLDALIAHYLKREEQPSDSLSAISHAVDRIFALVSRVEGTWEFEVQPLQEYFAGRFLYNSAPYIIASRESSGTKPVRFDGVAPNPYWLNVTRFFAGCFTAGELLDLSDRVTALFSNERTFGRTLAVSLLQDWVFVQSVKATRTLFENLFDHAGIRWAGTELRYSAHGPGGLRANLALTHTADSERLIEIIWPVFDYGIRTQRVFDAATLLRYQAPNSALLVRWRADTPKKGSMEFGRWLDIGATLNVLKDLPSGEVARLADASSGDYGDRVVSVLLRAGASIEELTDDQLVRGGRGLLNAPAVGHLEPALSAIDWLSNSTLWMILARLSKVDEAAREWYVNDTLLGLKHIGKDGPARMLDGETELLQILNNVILKSLRGRDVVLAFEESIRVMHGTFGATLMECEIGCISASISSGGERGKGAKVLTNAGRPLTDRVRFARGQVNNLTWWRDQVQTLNSEFDRVLWALSLYSWASASVLGDLVSEIEDVVALLPNRLKSALVRACRTAGQYSRAGAALPFETSERVKALKDPAAMCILAPRMQAEHREAVIRIFIADGIQEAYVANTVLPSVGRMFAEGRIEPDEMVDIAAACHDAGSTQEFGLRHASKRELRSLGSDWARLVAERSWNMPSDLLALAYRVLDESSPDPEPVLDLAARQDWFDGDNWGRH